MMTRSVYVRRLIPSDMDEYRKAPSEYAGEWKKNPSGEIGEIVSETFIPLPDPANPAMVAMTPIVGVCWTETTIPAISYESLAYLENIDGEMESEDSEQEEEQIEEASEG